MGHFNPTRDPLIEAFLQQHGWAVPQSQRQEIADASFRRYFRLKREGKTRLLMDAPPPESVEPYLRVAKIMADIGLSVPEIYGACSNSGLVLLEDFGNNDFKQALAGGVAEATLYDAAFQALVHWHKNATPLHYGTLPDFWAAPLNTPRLLVEWFIPEVTNKPTPPALVEEFLALWESLQHVAEDAPTTLVHRDFASMNLFYLPTRPAHQACGIIDFQDAQQGAATFDIASLLYDVRRDVAPAVRQQFIERYLAAFPNLHRPAFMASLAVVGARRNCRIAGLFLRLYRRDGKKTYLQYLPRVWGLIEEAVQHPVLYPVKQWLDKHVPTAWRSGAIGQEPRALSIFSDTVAA